MIKKDGVEAPNYTQVPNAILDAMPQMSGGCFKVLMAICRVTFGYHRQAETVSISDLENMTGLSRQGVVNATMEAEYNGIISRFLAGKCERDGIFYKLNIVKETRIDGSWNRYPDCKDDKDFLKWKAERIVKSFDYQGQGVVKSFDHPVVKSFDYPNRYKERTKKEREETPQNAPEIPTKTSLSQPPTQTLATPPNPHAVATTSVKGIELENVSHRTNDQDNCAGAGAGSAAGYRPGPFTEGEHDARFKTPYFRAVQVACKLPDNMSYATRCKCAGAAVRLYQAGYTLEQIEQAARNWTMPQAPYPNQFADRFDALLNTKPPKTQPQPHTIATGPSKAVDTTSDYLRRAAEKARAYGGNR